MESAGVDVSVVISAFRREHQVLEAIGGASARNDIALEVLVPGEAMNGTVGNTGTPRENARLRYFNCPPATEKSRAMVSNLGAGFASGRHLMFLNVHDILEGDSLTALSRALDCAPQAGMAFGAVIPYGENLAEVHRDQALFRDAASVARSLRSRMQLVANLLYMPPLLVNSACMVRRECFIAAGGYDSIIPDGGDIDLWMRIARSNDFVYLDRPIVHHHTEAPSFSQTSGHHIREKYRQRHGGAELFILSAWAKTTLRMWRN